MSNEPQIKFVAEIRQVKTMADYTANVTLNISERDIDAAAQLLKLQGAEAQVTVTIIATDDERGESFAADYSNFGKMISTIHNAQVLATTNGETAPSNHDGNNHDN